MTAPLLDVAALALTHARALRGIGDEPSADLDLVCTGIKAELAEVGMRRTMAGAGLAIHLLIRQLGHATGRTPAEIYGRFAQELALAGQPDG